MAGQGPPSQDEEFYFGLWDRDVEGTILSKIELARWRGEWIDDNQRNKRRVLVEVHLAMKDEMNVDIPVREYYEKEQQWATRYANFVWLLEQDGIRYNERDNLVVGDNNTWNAILRDRPNMEIYRPYGETNWTFLKGVYGDRYPLSSGTFNNTNSQDRSNVSFVSEVVDGPACDEPSNTDSYFSTYSEDESFSI